MRICMAFTHGLTPRKGGGIASAIQNIVKNTYKDADYVLLTTYDEKESSEICELYPSDVEIHYIKPNKNVFSSAFQYLIENINSSDILHFHNLPFGRDLPLLFKTFIHKKRVVYTHHIGYERMYNNRLLLGYYSSFLNLFGTIASRVIVNSMFAAENDLARFKYLHNKIVLIRNGVDLEKINSAKPLILEGNPSILYMGHLTYIKGIDILLESFKILTSLNYRSNPKLHIVGSGILNHKCMEYVASEGLGDKVKFWGAADESQKFRLLKGADIVAIPSRYEVAPLILIEAIAAGKPIVASRVGGIPEVLRQGVNGVLTRPTSTDLAIALKSFCDGQQSIRKYKANNKVLAKQFDWKNIAKLYLNLYKSMY
jgi:glycosyltransferase involved in cell wall biosynthesis